MILVLLLVAITIYALIDVILTPGKQVRTLPKWLWILLIVLLWIGGAALWFVIGRPRSSNSSVPVFGTREVPRSIGPDDDPDFIADLNKKKPTAD